MSNKKNNAIIFVIFIFFATALWFFSVRIYSIHGNKIEKIKIGKNIFYAEVVADREKLQNGLGGRNFLCEYCGMIFRFSQSGKYPFWMKDMHFPLDIVWIKENKIVHIEKNVPKNFSGILSSQIEANEILELNANMVDKTGIKIGDKISF